MINQELLDLLSGYWPGLTSDARDRVLKFYALMIAKNEKQNLTRLTAPKDFLEGHIMDVHELFTSGLVEFPAMDLGSGAGVPGLLAAAIRADRWILAESERHKAQFLFRMVQELNLPSVTVVADRGES